MNNQYDIILAGGGAAGLSLLYHLLQSDWKDRRILLIDRERKNQNDRTWCFWEVGSSPYESIVHQQWQHMYFRSPGFSQLLNLQPYTYKMIRGIDFYQHVYQALADFPNVTVLNEEVQEMRESDGVAQVITERDTHQGAWVFSSLRDKDEVKQANGHQYLLQHFKGWEIRTHQPRFNPQEATLMDFRIDQQGDCRFMYVLPTDEQTALVEYTIFSAQLLGKDEYNQELQKYMPEYLGLTNSDYQVVHQEFGVIPMTDMTYPSEQGKRIIRIGTAGGATKASTGYTFQRIQRDSQQLVRQLTTTGKISTARFSNNRFHLFDSVLLNVMGRDIYPAGKAFADLFKNNPPARVLRFLDEDTHLGEDFAIMNSVPKMPFIKGTWFALQSKFVAASY
ncbi:lycopene cyclase family protein [Tunicatimonas pelagia]|uniref:lycopene cyclase family protein n=1 Tax=Tunicatimonas pelagia TaxID=931531 RepID=UPI002665AD47|nr:lycopene cyclase family protein [Tunicatimonas pelagia]WKN42913.1 lycopene cyclase family protein [Tunicatimonas pelagia]